MSDRLSEKDGLRAQVEYLKRREKELEINVKRLKSNQLLMQSERAVLEQELQVERNRTRVAEAKNELLKAEIAGADSARKLSELRQGLQQERPM